MSFSPQMIFKMEATGNDFLIVDTRNSEAHDYWEPLAGTWGQRSEFARRICRPHTGLGADGCIFLETQGEEVKWDFYNSDGSFAEMCGNACRCVALLLRDLGGLTECLTLHTGAGPIHLRLREKDLFEVLMSPIPQAPQPLKNFPQVHFVNTGVPHAVVNFENRKPDGELRGFAQSLLKKNLFGPESANITFFFPRDQDHVESLSYERGVNDFTLSCGTGAVAAAMTYQKIFNRQGPIKVDLPGGQVFVEGSLEQPRLVGPAHWVARCQLYV